MPWGHSVETVLHGCGSAKHVSPSGQVSCDRPGRSGVIALAGRSLVIALKWAGRLITMNCLSVCLSVCVKHLETATLTSYPWQFKRTAEGGVPWDHPRGFMAVRWQHLATGQPPGKLASLWQHHATACLRWRGSWQHHATPCLWWRGCTCRHGKIGSVLVSPQEWSQGTPPLCRGSW